MKFFRRFIGIERANVGMRPHREFTVGIARALVFERALDAVARTLGATVISSDERAGTIEAAFGLVNRERLHVQIEAQGADTTRVVVEASYPAGFNRPARSQAVDVLADTLEARVGP
jgi:hypothetical protein